MMFFESESYILMIRLLVLKLSMMIFLVASRLKLCHSVVQTPPKFDSVETLVAYVKLYTVD